MSDQPRTGPDDPYAPPPGEVPGGTPPGHVPPGVVPPEIAPPGATPPSDAVLPGYPLPDAVPPGNPPYGYPPPSEGGDFYPPPGSGIGLAAEQRPELDGVSVAAFVCSFLVWPIGLVLGVLGVVRARNGAYRGRGLAVAATVLSALMGLGTAASVVVVGFVLPSRTADSAEQPGPVAGEESDVEQEPTAAPTPVASRSTVAEPPPAPTVPSGAPEALALDAIEVGDCLLEPTLDGSDRFSTLEEVDCNEAHDYQVVANVEVPNPTWPGQEEVVAFAERECLARTSDLLQTPRAAELDLAIDFFFPTSEGWAFGDREVNCLVYSLDGRLSEPVAP